MKQPSSGLTFIELIFAIAVMGIMMSAFYTLVVHLSQTYNDQIAIAETQQSVRVVVSLFANELQQTGLDPTGNAFTGKKTKTRPIPLFDVDRNNPPVPLNCEKRGTDATPIMEASQTVVHFMGDKDGNGTFNQDEENVDKGEDIRYEWVGSTGKDICGRGKNFTNTLYRDTGGNLQPVASGIKGFKLTYYDENGKLPDGILNAKERERIRRIELYIQGGIGAVPDERKREMTSIIVLKNRE